MVMNKAEAQLLLEEEEDVVSTTSSSTRSNSLPLKIQIALLNDIENYGSLGVLKGKFLSTILNNAEGERKELYGNQGDPIRKRITNKVYSWKQLSTREYKELLDTYQVKSFAERRKAERNTTKNQFPIDFVSKASKPHSVAPLSPLSEKSAGSFVNINLPDIMDALGIPKGAQRIMVNVERPTRNHEFNVYPIVNIPGMAPNSYYSGYWITYPVEPRFWCRERNQEWYKARVFTSNQILVTVPEGDYTMMFNRDELEGSVDECVLDALDNERFSYMETLEINPMEKLKHYILQFPDGCELSSKEIYENSGENEDLNLELHTVNYEVQRNEEDIFDMTRHFAAFKVVRGDLKAMKKGRNENEQMSKGANLFFNQMVQA